MLQVDHAFAYHLETYKKSQWIISGQPLGPASHLFSQLQGGLGEGLLLGKKDRTLTTIDSQQKKQKQTSSSKLKKIIVFIVFIVFNLDQLLL